MSRNRTKIISPDAEEVERLLRNVKHPRDQERLIVARMAMSGNHTLSMMAEAVGRARSCIQKWLDQFEKGGVEALLRRIPAKGNPPALSPEVQAQVKQNLGSGEWRTAKEFRQWLKEHHGVTLSLKGCYYWLGKSGGRLKAPRPSHHKQIPGDIIDFKMTGWEQRLNDLKIPDGEPVRFWVMDESRFGLHTVVKRCWGLPGARVVKPFAQRFEWEYLYGAIDIITGEPVFCHLPARPSLARRIRLWKRAVEPFSSAGCTATCRARSFPHFRNDRK